MSFRVGLFTTHPVQYQVPWYRALGAHPDVDLTVFYCMLPDARQQGEGFGVAFQWDIPLLEGYRYEVLANRARRPSVIRFSGCDTPEIEDRVRDGGFDAFIVNGWVVKACLQALRACRRRGVPCIVRGESNALRPRPAWKRFLHRRLLRRYSAFLSIGKSNRDFYLANGVPEEKIFFAPYCVENERFAAAAETLGPHRSRLRADWAIPPDAYTFLFCGKFVEKKRPLDLLAALEIACRSGRCDRPLHLLLVGEGDLASACRREAAAKRLPVTFAGFLNQSEIPRAYAAADCLILPSDYGETWGLVVNEAMACGLPAVVSDRVGCRPDLVLPGRTGEVFPFGDVRALAAIMVEFAADPEASQRLGRAARAHVATYRVENVLAGTLRALDYVCRDVRDVDA